jgi:hypothetical protein
MVTTNRHGTPDAGGNFATGFGRRPRGSYNKDKPAKDMLRRLLSEAGDDRDALYVICRKLIAMAKDGDLEAMNLLFNRVDGYPVRPIANEGDVPMFLNVSWLKEPASVASPLGAGGVLIEQLAERSEDHDPDPVAVRGNGGSGEHE